MPNSPNQSSLVTVITPVYNGESFLDDCISSVLNQSYRNFRYIIVDNCSTDRSLEIAKAAAAGDQRISVVQSTEHVGVIQNWNRSLASFDEQSDYIKFVHADDWLFPHCLERMVEVADDDDNVALVSSYRLEENRVSLDHLPADAPLAAGKDTFTMGGRSVARAILLERASVLGSPSSILMRTKCLGERSDFYNTDLLHADKEAALRLFRNHDFGFVRQVLVYTRRHNESVSSLNHLMDTPRQENLLLLKNFGSEFLADNEFQFAWKRELQDYYNFLAASVATGLGADFWASHAMNLEKAGVRLSRWKLVMAFLRRWRNPGLAWKQMVHKRSLVAGGKEGQMKETSRGSDNDNGTARSETSHQSSPTES